jgi:outer membrane protein assembly factor BamB
MKKLLTFSFLVLAIVSSAQATDWPQWRGPYFNGSTDETNLPTDWTQTEDIAWSVDVPGSSESTPVVWADYVFVSCADPAADSLLAMCFDRKTGKLLWRREVAKGIRKDSRSTFAAPSPATDGKRVVFFYGSGPLVAFDLDGKEKWSRNIQDDCGPFAFLWTFSSSPVLFDGRLYLQVCQRDVAVRGQGLPDRVNQSYLLAMDPDTGQTLWQQIRPSQARAESREAFTTPIPIEFHGRKELVIAGGDVLTGHDAATGKELWRWGTWNHARVGDWRLVPSPVASDEVILVCAPKRDPVYAIKGGGEGLLDEQAIAWTSQATRELSSDVPTPAYYDGDFFILSDVRKNLSRVDPKTGKAKWTIATPGSVKYEASPLAADGKLYLINFKGDVVVVRAEDGEMLSVISMGDSDRDVIRSSIVAANGQLFIRTTGKLYCVGS